MLKIFVLATATLYSANALSQQASVVQYSCNIEGVTAQLTAQVEVVDSSGIVTNSQGGISGVIGTGDYNIYYQGELVSPTASYSFVGENAYADFTELTTYARFRVLMEAQGDYLMMTINPFGDAPAQYLCQRTR